MAEGALHWFWGFVSEWKTGNKAELRLICEDGRLRVNMCADMGPYAALTGNFRGPNGLKKASPSRLRRSVRRTAAAARTEAENAAARAEAEKAAADRVSAAEKRAAENAASAEKTVAEKVVAESADSNAEEKVTADLIATTSTRGNKVMLGTGSVNSATKCGNCEGLMSPDHQCDSTSPACEVKLAPAPLPLCLGCTVATRGVGTNRSTFSSDASVRRESVSVSAIALKTKLK